MSEVIEPAVTPLPLETLYLLDAFFDSGSSGTGLQSKRLLVSKVRTIIDVLKSPGAVVGQVHVLRGHASDNAPNKELVCAVSEIHVSAGGVIVYSLENGEKYLVDDRDYPVPLRLLLRSQSMDDNAEE
ncbi:hypothetical protein [Paraburkholderia humisilvae]|uniref:Uncharacterized protein n=1 Tax=Paraburkholderia humisilvae TaxID=627669 RepID=A0A6J5F6Q1_9BURK|nr:hypothetical protein [Paraburkholderia humisilvae]CAB3774479.1 hypothetical protein LMG29542_07856 [Paraburkholderia humisilvae]